MITKVTYIVSNIDKALAFEWVAEKIDAEKVKLSFILLNNTEPFLYKWLKEKKIESYYIQHNGKKSYPNSVLKVSNLLRKIKPDAVHTHLFDANLIGLFSAKIVGIKERIYTRHHSTLHHENFPSAIKYDRLSNYLATKVIAISENVRNVLINKENISFQKTKLIHHGFDLDAFANVSQSSITKLKNKYDLENINGPIIGVVARFIKWKGIQHTIAAFQNILTKYPEAVLVLANANGPDKEYINSLLKNIPTKNLRLITFESNLFALYRLFNLYIHVPIDNQIEAFGQTYVEALASKTPSIFTLSGVANEYIEDNRNALVVDYNNSEQIEKAVFKLLNDKKLKNRLVEQGKKDVNQFKLASFISKLEDLYTNNNQ